MNTIEEYEIYKAPKKNGKDLLKNKPNFQSNSLYDTAIKIQDNIDNKPRYTTRTSVVP